MARIDQLRRELVVLDGLQRRADRLRGKTGRLEISRETREHLTTQLGQPLPCREGPDGTLTVDIAEFVGLLDAKLAE